MKAILKKSSAAEPFSFSFVNNDGKMGANKGINSVKKNCTEDKRYILKESSNGMYFFNVKSANGQVVATSAMYPSVDDRAQAINQIKALIPSCEVEEQLGG